MQWSHGERAAIEAGALDASFVTTQTMDPAPPLARVKA
jgi:hypothetical protein